jgi:hypothetical protein
MPHAPGKLTACVPCNGESTFLNVLSLQGREGVLFVARGVALLFRVKFGSPVDIAPIMGTNNPESGVEYWGN